jgi:hypothetical protein
MEIETYISCDRHVVLHSAKNALGDSFELHLLAGDFRILA